MCRVGSNLAVFFFLSCVCLYAFSGTLHRVAPMLAFTLFILLSSAGLLREQTRRHLQS